MARKGSFQRYRTVSVEEANRILNQVGNVYKLDQIIYGAGYKYKSKEAAMASSEYTSLEGCYLIGVLDSKLEITTSWWTNEETKKFRPTTWVCDLNEESSFCVKGLRTYSEFNKVCKIPKVEETLYDFLEKDETTGKYVNSAKPIIGYRGEKDKLVVYDKIYEYDLNSAYSSVILGGIPDLRNPLFNVEVGKGQVGFMLDDCLTMVKGGEAEVVFNIIECPQEVKDYIYRWYDKKKNSTGNEKQEAKAYLNLPIGYSQRTNPFFRAYVVNSCNNRIRKYLGKDVVLWNTDAIFSTKPLDMEIGKEIGQWKLIEYNGLRCIGNTYQIMDEIPVFRGIPKAWFVNFEKKNGHKFILGEDALPNKMNKYGYNEETNQLEEILYE